MKINRISQWNMHGMVLCFLALALSIVMPAHANPPIARAQIEKLHPNIWADLFINAEGKVETVALFDLDIDTSLGQAVTSNLKKLEFDPVYIGSKAVTRFISVKFQVLITTSENDMVNISLDEINVMPRPIKQVAPYYPTAYNGHILDGPVKLEFTIDANGHVRSPIIVDSKLPKEYNWEAIRTASLWQYQPFEIDGEPIPIPRAQIIIDFKFNKKANNNGK